MYFTKKENNFDISQVELRKKFFYRVQILRSLLLLAALFFISKIINFEISSKLILLFSFLGIFLSSKLLLKGISPIKILLQHVVAIGALYFIFNLANYLLALSPSISANKDFLIPLLQDQVLVLVAFYLVSAFSTILYWNFRNYSTWEAFVSSSLFIYLLSGHRNYQIDSPKEISSLSWKISLFQRYLIEPHHLFIALACGYIILLALYLFFSSNRPLFKKENIVRNYFKRSLFFNLALPVFLLAILFLYANILNKKFSTDLSRASEGVGQGSKEGQSNLGFHKAIGDNPQPTALVRLDGDYTKNPWAPMLYFREGALSEFAGREMVLAGARFDTDVPRVQVGQAFLGQANPEMNDYRQKISYSVFLISKHTAPPAIDYPTKISLLKNPTPEKFLMAYQATSFAPVIKLESLVGNTFSSKDWDRETLEHYLRFPGSKANLVPAELIIDNKQAILDNNKEDLRYLALTRKLIEDATTPLEKVLSILDYLSKNSIYTKNPGHILSDPTADPTAPYLFAEKMRGYCVHFSHAAVYLFRSAGIPARIGTGYLTDLSYAKDGHILLQMGDRHAWPEVYVENVGWVVADINPAQAENEIAPIPDSKLLEELMSKINPNLEFIQPETVAENDKNKNEISLDKVLENIFDSKKPLVIFGALLIFLLIFKLWLLFAYRFIKNPNSKAKLAYVSFATQVSELGLERQFGETKNEFVKRLNKNKKINAKKLISLEEQSTYLSNLTNKENPEIKSAMNDWKNSYDQHNKKIIRLIVLFNPLSISKLINSYFKKKF